MRIEISTKLRPFSHGPGTYCLIPGTTWEAQIFPALLRLRDLAGIEQYELPLSHRGPVKDFTVQQDLEKGCLRVWGHAQEGYFSSILYRKGDRLFWDDRELAVSLSSTTLPLNAERLSFGVHKQQDWQLMMRRLNPLELWPFLLRLAALTPFVPLQRVGSAELLHACEHADKRQQVGLWERVFMGCFQGILSPRFIDEDHQGLFEEKIIPKQLSPIGLIHEGARLLRSLFFAESASHLFLLPNLPPQCHSGRFIQIQTKEGDIVHLEWSKKSLKKVIVEPVHTKTLHLKLPKKIQKFRLRRSLRERGETIEDFHVECNLGEKLYLDRFL